MKRFFSVTGMLGFVWLLTSGAAMSRASLPQSAYRTIWYPTYHGQRLAYCRADHRGCGASVANRYCQLMGYDKACQYARDYTTKLARYVDDKQRCHGLDCNGFLLIRCKEALTHEPAPSYYYRERVFSVPRFERNRVDWCYANGQGCGLRAANSFCRRLGYMRATDYRIDKHASQTQAIGNHKWCLGPDCRGFSRITCYR